MGEHDCMYFASRIEHEVSVRVYAKVNSEDFDTR
jgi:hypothetical protein